MTKLHSYSILAINFGRGKTKYEVGIALIDLYYPHLILSQFIDNQVYSKTLSKLNVYHPEEIIIPYINSEHQGKDFLNTILEKFENINVTLLSSIHFSALTGWELIGIYSNNESHSVHQMIKYKYYSLSAASALLKYVMFIQHMTYAPKTLKIEFHNCEDTVLMDIATVESLELVRSLNEALPNFSLYNALNRCVTPMGKKLLRTSILQPPHNIYLIRNRIDSVSELISKKSLCTMLQNVLKQFKETEKLLNIFLKTNCFDSVQLAKKNLNYLLLLKSTIDCFPSFLLAINATSSITFHNIKHKFQRNVYNHVKQMISKFIQFDARYSREYIASNMQRCFAIKPKVSELLDILRQAYCEIVDKMIRYVENLSQKLSLPLSLGCNSSIGYYVHLKVHNSNMQKYELPKPLILLNKSKYAITLTTEQLLTDSQKCNEICEEIHIMSNVLVEDLVENLRSYNGCLFELCADIAELDLISSMAIVSSTPGFTQPEFGCKLCVLNAFHPIQLLIGLQTSIPNNIVASASYNFQLITGPNLSGKTTYLKQVILVHIIAQMGCYVPAQKAEIRLSDRLFFHSSNYYNIGNCISSFEYEVRGLICILDFLTNKSVIALDEPCMSASADNGISLAISICIMILDSKAFSFCTTHHPYFTRLSESYLNVTNLYFACYQQHFYNSTLIYTYKLKIGVSAINHYGIALAVMCHYPKSVCTYAKKVAQKLAPAKQYQHRFHCHEDVSIKEEIYAFISKIYSLIMNNQFNVASVSLLFRKYFYNKLDTTLRKEMNANLNTKLSIYTKERNRDLEGKGIDSANIKLLLDNRFRIDLSSLKEKKIYHQLQYSKSRDQLERCIEAKNLFVRHNLSKEVIQVNITSEKSSRVFRDENFFDVYMFYQNLLEDNLSL